jgi:hypothetical protein
MTHGAWESATLRGPVVVVRTNDLLGAVASTGHDMPSACATGAAQVMVSASSSVPAKNTARRAARISAHEKSSPTMDMKDEAELCQKARSIARGDSTEAERSDEESCEKVSEHRG